MSQSKMTSWEASIIAKKIAEKAFEHLVAPIDERINEYLRSRYRACMVAIGTTPQAMAEYGLGTLADTISVIVIVGDDSWTEQLKGNTDEFLSLSGFGQDFKFISTSAPGYVSLCTERAPLRAKQQALNEELADQLTGRSAKATMKAWPEAAQFIADEFGLGDITREMTKPLENLLAKYLPMLAPSSRSLT